MSGSPAEPDVTEAVRWVTSKGNVAAYGYDDLGLSPPVGGEVMPYLSQTNAPIEEALVRMKRARPRSVDVPGTTAAAAIRSWLRSSGLPVLMSM